MNNKGKWSYEWGVLYYDYNALSLFAHQSVLIILVLIFFCIFRLKI